MSMTADPSIAVAVTKAIVAALRDSTEADLASATGIYEGIAPVGATYPFVTYQLQYDVADWNWNFLDNHMGIAIFVWSFDQLEAKLIDRAIARTLNDRSLQLLDENDQPIAAQTLYLRRSSGLSFSDPDAEGRIVRQVGGVYDIWISQKII